VSEGARTALIGFGQVRHARLRPAHNAFTYPTWFLMLPMRTLASSAPALAHNRAGLISFWDRDHGDGRDNALAWLDELLTREGIHDASGEVWLHAYPRVMGYTFKPVSFWYCHRDDGSLRAIVVEVNNTFGERHVYLLDAPHYGTELTSTKAFHVSPFCDVQGRYRFRFMTTFADDAGSAAQRERTVVRIDYDDAQGELLQTSVSGHLVALTAHSLRRAFWRYGWLTLAVMGRIHWQALKLWFKRVPFFSKPTPPQELVTR
jgi:uncharacterized protein